MTLTECVEIAMRAGLITPETPPAHRLNPALLVALVADGKKPASLTRAQLAAVRAALIAHRCAP